ncbi:MAG TPA: hypothetical protein VFF81_09495 [Noviherbaspirillum sp.]|nr:hypothetical protein [Noviherbaspirillum sp.]
MDTGPDYELLKDAYAIIDGLPETAIDLDKLVTARGEALDQGTVCSPAAWLAQHPAFKALGLGLADDDSQLALNGQPTGTDSVPQVMARVFALRQVDADRLFADRRTYTLGDDSGLSDKRLWLHEVRDFLREHGQISEDFEDRLETRGPFAEPPNASEIRAI